MESLTGFSTPRLDGAGDTTSMLQGSIEPCRWRLISGPSALEQRDTRYGQRQEVSSSD
jgi:hypothetical protein